VYTRSDRELQGPWLNRNSGWCLRAESGPIEPNREYRIHAEIRRQTFRVQVRLDADTVWDVPLWDSGEVPMDALPATRLRFADAEPEGSTAASRWGKIVIQRQCPR
jgi:hypothetical protein